MPLGLLCSVNLKTLVVTPGNPGLTVAKVSDCPLLTIAKGYLAYLQNPAVKRKRTIVGASLSKAETDVLISVCIPLGSATALETNINCFLTVLRYCYEKSYGDECDTAYEIAMNGTIYKNIHSNCAQQRFSSGCLTAQNAICMEKFGPSSGQCFFVKTLTQYIYPNNGQMFMQGALNNVTKYQTLA